MNRILNMNKYKAVARQMAAEGCVLLKNDNKALPLRKNEKIAVFGRCATYYYKSGLGSGGLVNTRYAVSIMEALKNSEDVVVDSRLEEIYDQWTDENPIDKGNGWGAVPWSQKEMQLTEEMVDIASQVDASIIIIGRTAGEDQDNTNEPGSYLLTETELEMIDKVSKVCRRTIVLLNVGNIIDTKWINSLKPAAVMYVWQGGQEGGNGVADVLLGKVNPSGKLTDTIAYDLEDYPSTRNFGNKDKNYYTEDIFVGYRYFETFAENKVLFPFGYGLSYTVFMKDVMEFIEYEDRVYVKVKIINVGDVVGKEVVFVYASQPQGILGKAKRILVGFGKTKLLKPGEEMCLEFVIDKEQLASYDDEGKTGVESAFVLEEGIYKFYVGGDVHSASFCGSYQQKYKIIKRCSKRCEPREEFEHLVCRKLTDSEYEEVYEKTVTSIEGYHEQKHYEEIERKEKEEYNIKIANEDNDKKILRLEDVYNRIITMNEFVEQLSVEDCIGLFHGEGMCSGKVTPGTAAAFGGVTSRLKNMGVPVACCADGPSGIRMDCGTKAFSIPNGTMIGCSYNEQLTKELYSFVGLEMRKHKVDTLLGPGINIHRNPLNGRNFEYFSEDPYVTGMMCCAILSGLEEAGVCGTIKHYCANNQEKYRILVDAVVSERALREIYLKPFELAVKKGNARAVMTAYNPVNGIWASGNKDLCTEILRNEWGFNGIVMTDWWACANWEGESAIAGNRAPMVIAQNDIYMCCTDSENDIYSDNVYEMFNKGVVSIDELKRNARNILEFLLKTPAMSRQLGQDQEIEIEGVEAIDEEDELIGDMQSYMANKVNGEIHIEDINLEGEKGKATLLEVALERLGMYRVTVEISSGQGELAQLPISLFVDNIYRTTLSFKGGEDRKMTYDMGPIIGRMHYLKLLFGADGIVVKSISIIPLD